MARAFLPKNLLGRTLWILITPIILVQLVSNFVFLDRHLDSVTKLLAENIVSMSQTLLRLQQETLKQNPKSGEATIQKIASDFYHIEYHFARHKKTLPKIIPPTTWAEEYLIKELNRNLGYPYTLLYDDQHLVLSIRLPEGIASIRILRKRLMSKTTQLVFYWAIGTSLLALIIAALFMKNQVKPVRQLTKAMAAFGKGRDVPDFSPRGASEIRQMAAAFNVMKNRILRQITQRTEMLAGISHDLRTPLTRMKLELAMLQETDDIKALRQDVEEMQGMIQEYLEFVKQDTPEKIQTIDLSLMVEDILSRMKLTTNHVEVSIFPKRFLLTVRPGAFQRCLGNVLSNAVRYASHIKITAKKETHHAVIYVDDDGVGIPEEQREAVFKAFYRIENSRNLETGGIGLGLNIVQDIVHGHGGRVTLEDAPLGGLRVVIRLPL